MRPPFRQLAKDKKHPKKLTLREACNKIIHATKINLDLVIPNKATNPDQKGTHMRHLLYLYGDKNGVEWRAVLNLIEFVNWGSNSFLYVTGQAR
jgi:hypothetical protein